MILDLSAGKRAVWFNRLHDEAVFVDIRPEMAPTVVADTRQLPFDTGIFSLIVFDPPHMVHGKTSKMGKQYGSFSAVEIRDTVRESAKEAFRCATEDAVMALKWSDHDVSLDSILEMMEGWEPLFGHKVSTLTQRKTSTYWVLLRKRRAGYQPVSAIQRVLAMLDSGKFTGDTFT